MAETEEQTSSVLREFTGTPNLILSLVCFTIAVGHVYVAFDPGLLSELERNAFHFAGFAALPRFFTPCGRPDRAAVRPCGLML